MDKFSDEYSIFKQMRILAAISSAIATIYLQEIEPILR